MGTPLLGADLAVRGQRAGADPRVGRARRALRGAPGGVGRPRADADEPRRAARDPARVRRPRRAPDDRHRARGPRAAGPLDRHGLQRRRRAHPARGRRPDPRDAGRRPRRRRARRPATRRGRAAAGLAHALDGRLRRGREGRDGHPDRDDFELPDAARLRRQDVADARRRRDSLGGAARRPPLHPRARSAGAGHGDQQHRRGCGRLHRARRGRLQRRGRAAEDRQLHRLRRGCAAGRDQARPVHERRGRDTPGGRHRAAPARGVVGGHRRRLSRPDGHRPERRGPGRRPALLHRLRALAGPAADAAGRPPAVRAAARDVARPLGRQPLHEDAAVPARRLAPQARRRPAAAAGRRRRGPAAGDPAHAAARRRASRAAGVRRRLAHRVVADRARDRSAAARGDGARRAAAAERPRDRGRHAAAGHPARRWLEAVARAVGGAVGARLPAHRDV